MSTKWRGIDVCEIEKVSRIGGSFGREEMDATFSIYMKSGNKHQFHYNSNKIYKERDNLLDIFNDVNNIPETYTLENNIYISVDGESILFGCRVVDNKGEYIRKTLLEIDELKKQGKIKDEGWRHLLYICPLKIENKQIVYGELNDLYKNQLLALEIDFNEA